jgi:SAM-dependent methyltransferase
MPSPHGPRPARPGCSGGRYTRAPVADLPIDLDAGLAEQLARALDVEGKIPRTLEALGPVAGRDVLLVDGEGGLRAGQLSELGARVTVLGSGGPARFDAPEASGDVLVACWSAFRGAPEDELAAAERLLRPGGRLLVVHDYGRDDVATLRGVLPEHGTWSHRSGPFLHRGFRIRVVHCWWTFETLEAARAFLTAAFGDAAAVVSERLTRPRLSYNVAVYHRTFGEVRG